jgi:hypothetical protein
MRSEMQAEYVDWIAKYRWRIFCVFTLRTGQSANTAKHLLQQWFDVVQRVECRRSCRIAIPKRGRDGQLHFHVLIAGISSRVYRYAKQWEPMAGHVHMISFERRRRMRLGMKCGSADLLSITR